MHAGKDLGIPLNSSLLQLVPFPQCSPQVAALSDLLCSSERSPPSHVNAREKSLPVGLCLWEVCFCCMLRLSASLQQKEATCGRKSFAAGGPQGSRGWRWNACGVLLWQILPLKELLFDKDPVVLVCLCGGSSVWSRGSEKPWIDTQALST